MSFTKLRAALCALALAWGVPALAQVSAPGVPTIGPPGQLQFVVNGQVVAGTPLSLTITSGQFSSSTDLTPTSQFVNGWTADLKLANCTVQGTTADYAFGSQSAPTLSFTDTSPGYNSSAGATTVARTIYATSWLRETYPNYTLPTEGQSSANCVLTVTLNDFVYQSDTLSAAATLTGLYTYGGFTSQASVSVPITNNSTRAYPRPIAAWVTPPGERVGTSGSLTAELFAGHAYAQGGAPVAAVVFTLGDGTHTASHTVSSLTASAKQFSTSCTATNGSAQLTSCGSTAGLQVGERMAVPGIPGQPKILSLTSTTITFGVTTTCTPTLLGGEAISATPGVGEGLADGGFAGATITDAHLTTSPATIVVPVGTGSSVGASTTLTLGASASGQWAVGMFVTGTNIPAGDYISALGTGTGGAGTYTLHATSSGTVSGNVTGSVIGAVPSAATATTIRISTSSATGTASSGSCTINHVYQGSTGSVTVTLGNPVPVYSTTFTSGDFSTMTKGIVSVRAQVYPNVGNVVLDTQTGADGTQCDWFYIYDSGSGGAGVCDSGNAAWFATDGHNVSPNLHNLWAYNDTDNSYSPLYCFIGASGTATTTGAACSTSPTAPASSCTTTCGASINALLTSIKSYNNNSGNRTTVHNDLNGLVACYLAGTYTGFGGTISTSVTASKPGIIMTSVADSSACPASGSTNANLSGVTFGHNATTANLNPGPNARINNITLADTAAVIQGSDATNHTTFLTSEFVFNNDKFTVGGSPNLYQIGVADIYSSFDDESAHAGSIFAPFNTNTNTNRAFFNTIVGGSYSAEVASFVTWTALGNDLWGSQVQTPPSGATAVSDPQPTSMVVGFNRFMGQFLAALTPTAFSEDAALDNLLEVNNIFECVNRAGSNPCEQISADNDNTPLLNVVRQYDTVVGARTNLDYLEGTPLNPSVVGSGGSLAAGTYYAQTAYARVGNPTVETSTDGPTASITVGGTGTDSLSFVLPCDPNYVFYLYVDTSNPPAHSATVGGVDAKQIAGCQTVVATAIGGARTPPTVAGTTGHNELKTSFFQRFSIDNNFNMKNDTYGGSGATASGGRVGNWEGRWKAGWIGNVAVTGTQINSGYQPVSGLGEIGAYLDTYNPANSNTDLSWVLYSDDRSFGGFAATPVQPALNIGQSNLCPANSTHVGSRVPAGFAAYPWDIEGNTRKNDGTGWAGAYETGCN